MKEDIEIFATVRHKIKIDSKDNFICSTNCSSISESEHVASDNIVYYTGQCYLFNIEYLEEKDIHKYIRCKECLEATNLTKTLVTL